MAIITQRTLPIRMENLHLIRKLCQMKDKLLLLSQHHAIKVTEHPNGLCEVEYGGELFYISSDPELHEDSKHRLLIVLLSLLVEKGIDSEWTLESAIDRLVGS